MLKYAIFERALTGTDGIQTVSFTTLQNPTNPKEPVKVMAENDEEAVTQALKLLTVFGVQLYDKVGDPNLIMCYFPNYYVGRLNIEFADKYDDSTLVYSITQFIPIRTNGI